MKEKLSLNKLRLLCLIIICSISSLKSYAQGLIINEVQVNPSGFCDGICSPNTAEWIELYNSSDSAIDIGCYGILTTRFAMVIPPGTIIEPDSFYVIGSSNFGNVDLEWSTGIDFYSLNQLGVLSNVKDFIHLYNDSWDVIDGLVWTTSTLPIFPSAPLTITTNTCDTITINQIGLNYLPQNGLLLSSGDNGNSIARACDASYNWIERTQINITKGFSNGYNSFPNAPYLFGTDTFCYGDSSVLTAIQGIHYLWNNGDTTQSIVVNNSNTYSVTITDVNGCDVIDSIAIHEININTTTSINNNLISAVNTNAQYQWLNCVTNSIILGDTSQTYLPTIDGNYAVVISESGCVDTSSCVQIIITDLLKENMNKLMPIPNPNNGHFSLGLNSNIEVELLQITDVQGNIVYRNESSKIDLDINLEGLSAGLYYMQIISYDGKWYNSKFEIMK